LCGRQKDERRNHCPRGVLYRTGIERAVHPCNAALIVLGVAGVLQPATSALLHNASTLAVSLKSMTNLLA